MHPYVSNSNSILSDPDFLYGNISVIVSLFNGFKDINEYKKSVKMKEISELKVEKEFLKVIVETANAYKKVQIASEHRCRQPRHFGHTRHDRSAARQPTLAAATQANRETMPTHDC